MSPVSKKIFIALEVAVHLGIFFGALSVGNTIKHSDSLITQISPDSVPDVGFSLWKFNINGTVEDIEFSHEQEDEFGTEWRVAKTNYWVWRNFTVVFFSLPAALFLIGLFLKQSKKTLLVNLVRRVARVTIPVVTLSTVLMSVTMAMLMRSKLCGPSYVELGYQVEEDRYHHYGDDEDDLDYIGTNATLVADVPVSCELGASGFGTAVTLGFIPFVLIAQAFFLNKRANQLEASTFGEEETETATSYVDDDVVVAKVYDNEEETVSSKQSEKSLV